MMKYLSSSGKHINTGLLIMRIGVGIFFIFHGWPKIMGGPQMWSQIGKAMDNFGIASYPEFWGLMAGLAETFGGVLLILGLFFTPAALIMLINMIVAISTHIESGDSIQIISNPARAAIVFLGLLITGPGLYSLDRMIFRKKTIDDKNTV